MVVITETERYNAAMGASSFEKESLKIKDFVKNSDVSTLNTTTKNDASKHSDSTLDYSYGSCYIDKYRIGKEECKSNEEPLFEPYESLSAMSIPKKTLDANANLTSSEINEDLAPGLESFCDEVYTDLIEEKDEDFVTRGIDEQVPKVKKITLKKFPNKVLKKFLNKLNKRKNTRMTSTVTAKKILPKQNRVKQEISDGTEINPVVQSVSSLETSMPLFKIEKEENQVKGDQLTTRCGVETDDTNEFDKKLEDEEGVQNKKYVNGKPNSQSSEEYVTECVETSSTSLEEVKLSDAIEKLPERQNPGTDEAASERKHRRTGTDAGTAGSVFCGISSCNGVFFS